MSEVFPYLDPQQPLTARVEDLLSRMTVEEKVGQMCQLDGRDHLEERFKEIHPGSILQILNEDAAKAVELARHDRLKIPVLMAVDADHGHSFQPGATIFPTQLGVSCSWNPENAENMGRITALEMRDTGASLTFSPVLCITRDLRWGRVDETFGEDPLLIGDFACALIRGLQGDDVSSPDRVMACAKHYVGYSETEGGRDASESNLSRRRLRSFFMPPFERAAKAGAGSFMTSYQAIDGVPTTINRWALRQVLRDEWGFRGLTITDYRNVRTLVTHQKVCADAKTAAKLAVECGNDLIMATPEFFRGCLDALADGSLDIKYVDEAVRRILTAKFMLRLFEDDRMPRPEEAKKRAGTPEHRRYALQAARESLTLLSNNGILPLRDFADKKIFLVGRNADDALLQCGDWSLGSGQCNVPRRHPRECTVTIFDALRKEYPGRVSYFPRGAEDYTAADLVVAVVGDSIPYWGELKSLATLELQDGQPEMLRKLAASGKPFIIVLQSGKPLIIPEDVRRLAAAVFVQFSPGMLGGEAFAEAVSGRLNPSGRLSLSMPYHAGQTPVYYNRIRGQHCLRYADLTQSPVYAFGEGIGYSPIVYSAAKLDREVYTTDDTIKLTVELKNRGEFDAVETVQAYVSDLVTSATWPEIELKGYRRVKIPAGQKVLAEIKISVSACSIVNADEQRVVEPGDFELRVGPNSRTFIHTLPFKVRLAEKR